MCCILYVPKQAVAQLFQHVMLRLAALQGRQVLDIRARRGTEAAGRMDARRNGDVTCG